MGQRRSGQAGAVGGNSSVMRKASLIYCVAAVALMSTAALMLPYSSSAAMPAPVVETVSLRPTFSRDIAPILYKNCAGCHRTGELAPMSLLTYEEARPWARSI